VSWIALMAAVGLAAADAQAPTGGAVATASPGPLLPLATVDSSLVVTGEKLKAEEMMSRMLVRVMVNDRGPYLFIVDSGSDRSVIGADLAKRLELPIGKQVTLQSLAGPRQVQTVLLDRLGIGESEVNGIDAPALPEQHLGADGLIGIDALAQQRLMLDFVGKSITIEDARRSSSVSTPDEIVVTARRHKGQLILTQGTIGGQSVYAVLDTGAQVTVGNSALKSLIFKGDRPPPSTPISLVSVTGQIVTADLVVVPEVRLGGLIVRGLQVAFSDVPPFKLFGLADRPALLLGTDLLEQFSRISLDFRRRRVRFLLRG
jgi:predicted aspartyl protease